MTCPSPLEGATVTTGQWGLGSAVAAGAGAAWAGCAEGTRPHG